MKVLRLTTILFLVAAFFTQCSKDHHPGEEELMGMFTVTIENVSPAYDFFQSGVATIPDGETESGPALPGQSFTFSFYAGKSHKLSFATMYGASNDFFYGPSGEGIPLYDDDTPITGDITDWIHLWDAGTEVNEEPGVGANTGPQQPAPNTGPDENGPIRNIDDVADGYTYPAVNENLLVMIDYDEMTNMFTVTIDNLAGSTTGISPVVWGIHGADNVLFEEGMPDYGNGLEQVAEDGNFMPLGDYVAIHTGYASPIAPGVWVLHQQNDLPLFSEDSPDYGQGLEKLAEMGDPSELASALMNAGYESGVYNMPEDDSEAGPLFPGQKYQFSVAAGAGEYLSFASMLGASNDLFFAPGEMGIKLFDGAVPLSGDITSKIMLWDAGTEVNEYPGAQTAVDAEEGANVMMVDDGFMYPDVNQIIKVTIRKN